MLPKSPGNPSSLEEWEYHALGRGRIDRAILHRQRRILAILILVWPLLHCIRLYTKGAHKSHKLAHLLRIFHLVRLAIASVWR